MKNGRGAALALLLLLATIPASAQTDPEIEPDRPDVTNGTHVVPPGLVQLEFGGLFLRDAPGQTGATSPFTFRVGIFDWLEARVGADGISTTNGSDPSGTGFGNVQLGAKLRLWADPGGAPVLSILPNINFGTADSAKGLGSGDTDFSIAVLTGTDIHERGHIDVNYGIGAIGGGAGRPHYVQHLVSASLSEAVTGRFNPYVEVFWFSRTDIDGAPETAMDAGIIYELGSRFAVDGGLQFGVGGPASDFGVFAGLTVIMGGNNGLNGRQRAIKAPPAKRR
jgi:hypothetical protein